MNLHHLFVFCSVAKYKSFGKAAKEINISQPAISQQLQKLENSLDKKLVERKGKYFKLTTHGEIIYEYGQRIFELVTEAKKSISISGGGYQKLLLGSTIIPGTSFLLDFISSFSDTKMYIDFRITIEKSNIDLIEKILNNQLDVAMSYESIILNDKIKTKKIAIDEFFLVVSAKHPWSDGRIISFKEALTLPFIFFNNNSFIQQIFENILTGDYVNVVLQLNSLEMVKSSIIRGLGVSILPYSSIKYELNTNQLAIINCNSFQSSRNVIIMYKNSKSQLAQYFIDFITSAEEN